METPNTFSLSQNYPNLLNPGTTIEWYNKKESPITLKVFNNLEQEVATLVDGTMPSGHNKIIWDVEEGDIIDKGELMKFIITILRDDDGMGIAECPSIPGCVSQGKIEEEAHRNI